MTKVLPNVRNVWFNVILVLPYVTMVPSNVRKKIIESPKVTKVQSHLMLVLYNVRTVLSNVRKNKLKYNQM